MVERGSAGIWKQMKNTQATKHELYCATGNKNIQSEYKKTYIRVMKMKVNG